MLSGILGADSAASIEFGTIQRRRKVIRSDGTAVLEKRNLINKGETSYPFTVFPGTVK